jgi:hypothetical protein
MDHCLILFPIGHPFEKVQVNAGMFNLQASQLARTQVPGAARKEARAGLVEKLTSGQVPSVEGLLSDPDFLTVARTDPPALATFLSAPDPYRNPTSDFPTRADRDNGPRLHTLVEWALSDLWNTDTNIATFKLYQINKNAATFLSSTGRRVGALVSKSQYAHAFVRNFIHTSVSLNPMFAGHFQRIVEAFLRSDIAQLDNPVFMDPFIVFAIENINVLAYQQLMCHIVVDIPVALDQVGGTSRIIQSILRGAAHRAFIVEQTRHIDARPIESTTVTQTVAKKFRPPVNSHCVEFAEYTGVPHRITGKFISPSAPGYSDRLAARRLKIGFPDDLGESFEMAQLKAYLLVNSIATMAAEDSGMLLDLQTPENRLPFLELLLTIGVYSDPYSMVAKCAFRLADWIVNGLPEGDDTDDNDTADKTPPSSYFEDDIQNLLNDFAQDFNFSKDVTAQMIAAFPLFWNYRYADLADPDLTEPPDYPDVELMLCAPDGDPDEAPVENFRRAPGLTPLELYGQFMLSEPPMNDGLNREIKAVFKRLQAEIKKIDERQGVDPTELLRLSTSRSLIFYEFLRTKFVYQNATGSFQTDMEVLRDSIPLIGIHSYYLTHAHRAPLNGAILWLMKFLINTSIFGSFELSDLAATSFLSEESSPLVLEYTDLMEGFDHRARNSRGERLAKRTREDVVNSYHEVEPV